MLSVETAGPPRFLGNPCACAPPSPTPVGPRCQAIPASQCWCRSENHGTSRNQFHFEALSRGSHAPCVRFAAGVAPEPRNTRFRLVASLCRAGFSRRVPLQSFSHGVTWHPPCPGCTWRTFRGNAPARSAAKEAIVNSRSRCSRPMRGLPTEVDAAESLLLLGNSGDGEGQIVDGGFRHEEIRWKLSPVRLTPCR